MVLSVELRVQVWRMWSRSPLEFRFWHR